MLRAILILALLCACALGQICPDGKLCVTFSPISISATESKPLGFWEVLIVYRGPGMAVISSAEILMGNPKMRAIPNDVAESLLTKRQGRDKRMVASMFSTILGTALAIWLKDPRYSFIGAGTAIGGQLLAKNAFDPNPLIRRLIPDSIPLTPGSGYRYLVATSIMDRAQVEAVGPIIVDAGK